MRIGIDFDNTIICYDGVFCDLAKSWKLISADYQGSKRQLRDFIRTLDEGEIIWQRMQGKAYGECIKKAEMFAGFRDFLTTCSAQKNVELFIVSHKTEFGHFDESRIPLRDAARQWLRDQGFFHHEIAEANVFFESTREEKIERIKNLRCTHFIDDLVEVLYSPQFPHAVERFLFQPYGDMDAQNQIKFYSSWKEINNAIFPQK